MDYRKSLKEILEFEQPEELCRFEWGYWPETVSRWKREGMPEDKEPWEAVGISHYHRAPVEPRLYPPFEEEELYEDGDKRVIRDENGIIKEVFKDDTVFPHFFPIRLMWIPFTLTPIYRRPPSMAEASGILAQETVAKDGHSLLGSADGIKASCNKSIM